MNSHLIVERVTKAYGPTVALDDVSITFQPGEVHAIIGENGSGKSTLVKILAGIASHDRGTIRHGDRTLSLSSPRYARRHRIAAAFQELSVLTTYSVAENIFIGRYPHRPWGAVDRRKLHRHTAELLEKFGIDLPPGARCADLTLAQLQLVEIARALGLDPDILMLDEATSALDKPEAGQVLNIARQLADAGKIVIFISHRLDEIFRASDRVTVLREGKLVMSAPLRETTSDQLLQSMLGAKTSALFPDKREDRDAAPPLLEVRIPPPDKRRQEVRFAVEAGEIVGLAGLQGHGQKRTLRILGGDIAAHDAEIRVGAQPLRYSSPRQAIAHGLYYIPEERKVEGILSGQSVASNMTLSAIRRVTRLGVIRRALEARACQDMRDQLKIRMSSVNQPIDGLSGGNQQKAMLGRALLAHPRVLLLDDPMRGIDVGAKHDLYDKLRSLAAQGVAVVMNSTELPELVGLCDRVLVFRSNEIVAELRGEAISEERILAGMFAAQPAEEIA